MSKIVVMTKEIEERIKDELKKLLNGEVEKVEVSGICPNAIVNIFSDAGADVSDDLDTNGWEYDYWIKATYNGKKYTIDGGGYYGHVTIEESDE